MFTFLLIVQAIVATLLVTLILMQRSEGGGLGVGGSSSGLMTARGQADFLTRATAITAVVFVGLSILLAGLATTQHGGETIDASAAQPAAPAGNEPLLPGIPETQPQGQAPAPADEQPVDDDILSTITGQAESGNAGGGSNDSEE